MTDESPSRAPDSLLRQSAFVRSVARALLRDEHTSDDVVQDTWLAAMKNPPQNSETTGAWLSTVVRNFVRKMHRTRTRRSAREEWAAKPEAVEGPSEFVVRQSILREVVDAIGELPEAYREVILLRYYEDLPPREIAARLGCPTTTIQSRLQRAHEALRRRLEEKSDSNDWRAQLLLLVGPPAKSVALPLATAAVVILVGGATIWTMSEFGRSSDGDLAPMEERSSAMVAESAPRRRKIVPIVPRWFDSRADMVVNIAPTVRISGRVIDPDREPRTDVVIVAREWGEELATTRTNADGVFEFDVPSVASSDGISLVGRGGDDFGFETRRPTGTTGKIDFGSIPLRRTQTVGIAAKNSGLPIADAVVRVKCRDRRVLDDVLLPPTDIDVFRGRTDKDGRIKDLRLTIGHYDCFVEGDGLAGRSSFFVFDGESTEVAIDLAASPRRKLVVFDETSGKPMKDAYLVVDEIRSVSSRRRMLRDLLMPLLRSDEKGVVEITIPPDGSARRIVAVSEGRGSSRPVFLRDDGQTSDISMPIKSGASITIDRPMPKGRLHVEVDGDQPSAAQVQNDGGRPKIEGLPFEWSTILLRSDSDGPAYEIEKKDGEISIRDLAQKELTVTIVDADQEPVPNVECELIDVHAKFPRSRRVASDAAGKFSVRGLVGATARLEFGPQNDLFDSRRRIEVVALDRPSTEHSIRVGEKRRLDVDILIGGRPAIPAVFTVLAVKAFTGQITEDRERSRITVEFWNDDRPAAPEFIVHAPGYQPIAVSLPREEYAVTREVDLERAGRVVVDMIGAEHPGRDLHLDWISDDGTTTTLQHEARSRSTRPGEVEFDGLTKGRYRVRDAETGISSAPFTIEKADRTMRTKLDLSAVRTVELVPEFENSDSERHVILEFTDEEDPALGKIARRIPATTSLLKLALGRKILVRPVDPELVLSTKDGTATLDADATRAVLPFTRGATVRLLLPEESSGKGWALLERLDGNRPMTWTRPITSRSEIGRFGAVPAGRFKISLRLDDHLPLDIGEWTLTAGENELPEFDFDPGASILFRFAESTIGRLPPLDIIVRSDDGKIERIGAYLKDERSIAIEGLTPGPKTIEFRGKNLGLVAPPATRTVKLDRRSRATIDIE